MLHRSFIYLIFFLVLFGGLIEGLGAPRQFAFAIEFLIAILLLFSIFGRSGKGLPLPHLWHIFFSFLFITIFSIYVNDSQLDRPIFSLRMIFRFYFFYVAIIIMQPDNLLIKKLNWFIALLLVLQFPVVAVKFSQYGIHERTHGAYAVYDGSIAAMLPVVVVFYFSAFYYLYQPKIIYLIIGIGYIILSIVGEKRAVLFIYPFQFIAIYYFFYVKGKGGNVSKKVFGLIVLIPFVILLTGTILYFHKTLSPDRQIRGRVDLAYALEYAKQYSYGVDGYGRTYGRIATTLRVIEILKDSGVTQILLGVGPGSTTPSFLDSKTEREAFERRYETFKIAYGLTSINRIALEYGLAGVLIFISMLVGLTRMCLKLHRIETEPYWKAFAAGSVWFSFAMFFFAITYHFTAFWGGTMPALYFYSMAVVYIRNNRQKLTKTETSPASLAQQKRHPLKV